MTTKLLLPLLAALLGLGSSASAAEFRYRFDRAETLEGNGEYAVRLAPGSAAPRAGFVPLGPAGWYRATATGRSAADLRGMMQDVLADPAVEFATPVFRGIGDARVVASPRVLARFRDGVAEPERAKALAATALRTASTKGAWLTLESGSRNGLEVLDQANALMETGAFLFAEVDWGFEGRAALTPNDALYSLQWGLHNTGQFGGLADMDMDVPEAWDRTLGSASIIVGVFDTGVQLDHPDLNIHGGIDTTGEGSAGAPGNACESHGTAVSGCISATIDNTIGVAGVAPNCPTYSVRFAVGDDVACNGSWFSFASFTVDGLDACATEGARVTNNSNYYGFTSSAIETKYAETKAAGMVHFASAGNDGTNTISYPSSIPEVNSVAALEPSGIRAFFSQYGAGLDFSAPGTSVYSTDRTGGSGYIAGDYVIVQGTSFASPYASAVAALVLSVDPSLTAAEVEALMQSGARDLGTAGYDTDFGWGFVNAEASLPPPAPSGASANWSAY